LNAAEWFRRGRFMLSAPFVSGAIIAAKSRAVTYPTVQFRGATSAGFTGPRLFIDMNIFTADQPKWIEFDEQVDWSGRGMRGTFGSLISLNAVHANRLNLQGIRDAFEIAEELSPNPEILRIIRASRIGDLRKLKPKGN